MLKLHNFDRSPFCWKTRLVLAEKKVPFEAVVPKNKAEGDEDDPGRHGRVTEEPEDECRPRQQRLCAMLEDREARPRAPETSLMPIHPALSAGSPRAEGEGACHRHRKGAD